MEIHRRLTKKLFNLFTGELVATITFAIVWMMFISIHEWTEPYLTSFAPLYAFFLLEFLLLQGSYYWFLKWRQAKRRDFSLLPKHQLNIFRVFKTVNLLLLGLGFGLLIYELISFAKDLYWFLFLYLFALAEYINYYHVRLSYQSMEEIRGFMRQRKFRKSKLAGELK